MRIIGFKTGLILLLGVWLALPAVAGRYKLPSYLSSAYFTGKLTQTEDGLMVPDRVYNVVKADEEKLRGTLVLNLLGDKGSHDVEIHLLDKDARKFDTIDLEPIEADSDDYAWIAVALFAGPMPEGGVFFKIYDRHDDKPAVELGTIRLLTLK